MLKKPNVADGIFAITRHPVMWGIRNLGCHAYDLTGDLARFAFFGAFAATALIGSWLQQNRKRDSVSGLGALEAKTSFFPFMAVLQGRAKFSLRAMGWWRIAIAVVAWAAILHFHSWLFGAHPLPISA